MRDGGTAVFVREAMGGGEGKGVQNKGLGEGNGGEGRRDVTCGYIGDGRCEAT